VEAYQRMANEDDPDQITPVAGGRRRLKWGKQQSSNNDEPNINRSPGGDSQDRSSGESNRSKGSGSYNSSQTKKSFRNISGSIKDTPKVHAGELTANETSSLNNRSNVPFLSSDRSLPQHNAIRGSKYWVGQFTDDQLQGNRSQGSLHQSFSSSINLVGDDTPGDEEMAPRRSSLRNLGQRKRQLAHTTVLTRQAETTRDSTQTSNSTSSPTLLTSTTSLNASLLLSAASGPVLASNHNATFIENHHDMQRDPALDRPDLNPYNSFSSISGETDDDRMIRLAIKMSLKSFRENEKPNRDLDFHDTERDMQSMDNSEAKLKNSLDSFYRQDSRRYLVIEERRLPPALPSMNRSSSAHIYNQLDYARKNMPKEEVDAIEQALHNAGEDEPHCRSEYSQPRSADSELSRSSKPSSALARRPLSLFADPGDQLAAATHLSLDEAAAIEQAIREAEEEEQKKSLIEQQQSLMVALELQNEESTRYSSFRPLGWQEIYQDPFQQTQEDTTRLQGAQFVGASCSSSPPRRHAMELQLEGRPQLPLESQRVVRPQPEVETVQVVQSQPPREFRDQPKPPLRVRALPIPFENEDEEIQQNDVQLGMEADEDISFVSNSAYSQFTRSTITSRDTARSSTSTLSCGSKRGESFRLQFRYAATGNLIQKCNGFVKEGATSRIYHAIGGTKSRGADVAIKVFKKVVEFGGNPEQLERAAQKEYSSLLRASKARVPVPTPLAQEGNAIFMRFMGDFGWPAPQLETLDLRKGSGKWNSLYSQVMVSVRRLYVHARLVHGDLNESHILVCPAHIVDNDVEDVNTPSSSGNGAQTVFIDFRSAVDTRHASSTELLKKDLTNVRNFFVKRGIKTLGLQMAFEFVIAPEHSEEENCDKDETCSHDTSGGGNDNQDEDCKFKDCEDDAMGYSHSTNQSLTDNSRKGFEGSKAPNRSRGVAGLESKPHYSVYNMSRSDDSNSTPATLQTVSTANSSTSCVALTNSKLDNPRSGHSSLPTVRKALPSKRPSNICELNKLDSFSFETDDEDEFSNKWAGGWEEEIDLPKPTAIISVKSFPGSRV